MCNGIHLLWQTQRSDQWFAKGKIWYGFWFMVFSATFNNIAVISWRSVLLVDETGVPGENHRSAASHWQTLAHNVVSSMPRHQQGSSSQLVVIGTAYTGSCKSNYHTIRTTTAPRKIWVCTLLKYKCLDDWLIEFWCSTPLSAIYQL